MSTSTRTNTGLRASLALMLAVVPLATGCANEEMLEIGGPVVDLEIVGVEESGEEITARYPAGTTARTTANLNLRTGASTSNRIILTIPNGSSVRLITGTPTRGWYNVTFNGHNGWAFGQYLAVSSSGGGGGTSTPPTTPTTGRGYLDADRGWHNVFGGIEWRVENQSVILRSGTPSGSVSGVSACMSRYGASIRRWADHYRISRASVVATAITESNCTNPSGSSDGLSSGPMQVTGSTCAGVTGLSSATCKSRMHSDPDFSFEVGVRYMASSYQLNQHNRDAPKVAAAYNAGSLRSSSANRWRMVVTGNHIDRFVDAYNAYRAWERSSGALTYGPDEVFFDGEHVATQAELPATARDGQSYFVGDWDNRDGYFFVFFNGEWRQQ